MTEPGAVDQTFIGLASGNQRLTTLCKLAPISIPALSSNASTPSTRALDGSERIPV